MLKNKPWPVTQLIAHRGASAIAPENTLAALKKAHEMGMAWVEADVRLTLDNEVVVFHDAKLDRCTNGQGLVKKTPYQVISQLDAGRWFHPHYTGEKIPRLDQWLDLAAKLGLGIILDLKAKGSAAKRLADLVSVFLARYWNGHLPKPIISSKEISCLRALSAQQLGWNLAYVMRTEYGGWIKDMQTLDCLSVHLDHEFISEPWLEQLKKHELRVAAYTVNDPARAHQLFTWGVDSIFTDNPLLLSE